MIEGAFGAARAAACACGPIICDFMMKFNLQQSRFEKKRVADRVWDELLGQECGESVWSEHFEQAFGESVSRKRFKEASRASVRQSLEALPVGCCGQFGGRASRNTRGASKGQQSEKVGLFGGAFCIVVAPLPPQTVCGGGLLFSEELHSSQISI